jgi:iron(III) transport system permease protein
MSTLQEASTPIGVRIARFVGQYGVMVAMFILLGAFLLYPIGLTIRGGVSEDVQSGEGFTLHHVAMVFKDPLLREGLRNSLTIAMGTTTLAICIALPLAILSARYRFPFKGLFNALILVPMIMPPFVGAIGVKALLGRQGGVNALLGTDWDILGKGQLVGIMVVQSLYLFPIIYLNATAALANLDPALDEAAENLGAGPWRRLFRIVLPLVRPGIFAGATIVLIWSFTELGTPLIFDYYRVTPVQIFYGLKEVENASPRPYALTLVLLVTAVTMYLTGRILFGGKAHAMYAKASRASAEKPLMGVAAWGATGAFALVCAVAMLPHFGVILTSLTMPGQWYRSVLPTAFTTQHYVHALTYETASTAIGNSLMLATLAMLLNLVIGVLVAYVVVRTKARGRGVLDALCMLPIAVPGLVMAFGYVAMTLRWPFDGSLPRWLETFLGFLLPDRWVGAISNAPLDGTWFDLAVLGADPNPFPLLVIAYAVRRLPYVVRSTVAGLQQTSGELEEAAVNLGASRVKAVRKIILPLIMANLIAGGILVFSFSMLEVSDSLILAQQQKHYPFTKAIIAFTERLGDGAYVASAMGVWGMALLATTLLGASLLLGKKLGAIFRA